MKLHSIAGAALATLASILAFPAHADAGADHRGRGRDSGQKRATMHGGWGRRAKRGRGALSIAALGGA